VVTVRTSSGDATPDRATLVAASSGDEGAFADLVGPHRAALHVHCYRMLGSVHDADDALQETLLRAWRGLGGYEPRAPLASWLYRIATHACLRMIERRRRGSGSLDAQEAAIAAYLEPYPDELLAEIPADTPGPEALAETRESVALSVVAAAQLLPPKQRAVLMLRDVLGWSARDTADLLDDTVPAVNSALQRARERLEREQAAGALARDHRPASEARESEVMQRFLDAWEAVDVDAIVELLADDALLTMPPEPMRIVGAEAIGDFFRTVPAGGFLERIRLVPTRSNGQPAVAAYLRDGAGPVFRAYGVMVFALDREMITSITGFADFPALVPRFGLPETLG
jgi:RNA polymerase sigma-70 factor (ECF subfamily)